MKCQTITAQEHAEMKHSGNTSKEEILEIWKRTGTYYHDPLTIMENVFPAGSMAYDYCNAANYYFHGYKHEGFDDSGFRVRSPFHPECFEDPVESGNK